MGLIFAFCFALLPAQDHSRPVKRKWYDSVVRLIRGGDGHYYLIRNHNGQYWHFGRTGLHRFEVMRFGPDLELRSVVRIGGSRKHGRILNAYEVLPGPQGIAFLSVARKGGEGMHELQLCSLSFPDGSPVFKCGGLAALHDFTPKVSQPDIRVAYSPDSSNILVTWRLVSNRELSDKSTACLVLDRDLRVVAGPFSPLLGAQRDCRLLRIGIAEEDRLFFWIRAYEPGGMLTGPQSASFHLLEYDGGRGRMRELRLGGGTRLMMDARLHFDAEDRIRVAGWWLDGKPPSGEDDGGPGENGRPAGIFFGEIGNEDTLTEVRMREFDAVVRREMLPRSRADGDVWFRPSYNNQLLPTDSGFVYVLHLLGQFGGEVSTFGKRQDNALLIYPLDREGRSGTPRIAGFCNDARSDYQETYSWVPVPREGGWEALASDFSAIGTMSRSHLGNNVLLPLAPPGAPAKLEGRLDNNGEYWLIVPRMYVEEGPGIFTFLAKSRKHYRLERCEF